MTALDQRAKIALQDIPLQQALNKAMDHFVDGRESAFAALPHGEALRDSGRVIRANTIAHLDEHLLEFERNAQTNGSQVHWARDGEEARKVVMQIVLKNDVKSVVKSKSMLSEEIEVNSVIERAGLKVVETDLGEYIVQLGDDHPSHIIAPVVHWRQEDVAELFNQHLDTPLDADIPDLVGAARQELRQEFIQADMGISGANFAVSETGSIVLVTNEGNGRYVTTTPRIHIALVGIERLAPTLSDLGNLLQILARSATGQPLSTYTSIVTGPRRSPEEDGPEQVHIVLVDNGRSNALAGEMAEILYCIRCGACLNVCPVYRNIGGHAYNSVYPGPVGIVVTPVLRGPSEWSELPQASSLCGACTEACPVRINIPRMLLKLRSESVERDESPSWLRMGLRGYTWAATRPKMFRMAGRMGSMAQKLMPRSQDWTTRLPGPLSGWSDSRAFPPLAKKSFSERWAEKSKTNSPDHTSD